MSAELKELQDAAKKNAEGLATLTKSMQGLIETLKKTPAPAAGASTTAEQQVFGTPHIRTGEDPMTSRGFRFIKMLGVLTRQVAPEDAKVEMQVHHKFYNCLKGEYKTLPGSFMAPLSTDYLSDEWVDPSLRREVKQLVHAGVDGADWDEMKRRHVKRLEAKGYGTKALSWLNELTGGALVAPPEMGELIELLRNKEALVNAGARTIPLPPQGRLKFPRQTAASTTYWVGENARITDSNVGTGEVTLQAKKLAVLIQAPNELIRFASPAAEALLRDDMTKSLALGLDLAGLEGAGGDTRPRGVINHPDINRVTSTDARANGDKLIGQDAYRMVAAIQESNAEMEGWIMRPKTLHKFYQLRAAAVAQGDAEGMFLFDPIRQMGDEAKPNLAGYPVTLSTQVSQVRAKGSSTSLTYLLAGMWSDVLIGMFGAIEFTSTTLGDTPFQNDQTWVKGILTADVAIRHEAAFALLDNIDTTITN